MNRIYFEKHRASSGIVHRRTTGFHLRTTMCTDASDGFLEVAAHEEKNTNEAQRRGQIELLIREKEKKKKQQQQQKKRKKHDTM